MKIDVKGLLSVAGLVLTVAGTIVTGVANEKLMQDKIAKEVAKALQK